MKRFLKGFYFAARGVVRCLKTERNMRIHFCAAFYVLIFMPFYGFTKAQKSAIFLAIGLVISAEAINTAIEAAADFVCDKKNRQIEVIKDAAAGAVLVAAIAAAAVGITLFFDADTVREIFAYLSRHVAAALLLLLSAAAWIYLITRPTTMDKTKKD